MFSTNNDNTSLLCNNELQYSEKIPVLPADEIMQALDPTWTRRHK